MDLVDIVFFSLFRACELAGAAIFAVRLGTTLSGILGTVGFVLLFLISIGQRFAIMKLEFSPEIWGVSTIASMLAFGLVLCALWLVPARPGGREV